jgi:hypothetical protein
LEPKLQSRTDFTLTENSDLDELFASLRTADKEEMVALHGFPFEEMVRDGIKRSDIAWSMWVDGRLAAVFGVVGVSVTPGIGVPWLLGTQHLERHGGRLVRFGARYIDQMHTAYPVLMNYVSAENDRSIRWLENLGFSIDAPSPLGPYRVPFRRFHKGLN